GAGEMNERLSDEERAALIAEHGDAPLAADAADDLAIMTDLLADPSMWAEPPSRLEEAVAYAVDAEPATATAEAEGARARRQPSRRRRTVVLSAVAAAAAIVIALGAVAVLRSSSTPDYTAQLAATSVVPGAHASADITQNNAGFRVSLHAHGLPKLPAGE